MPKDPGSAKGHHGSYVDQKSAGAPLKGARREILFPTEPTTIGQKKIDRAVERVISRKK